MIRDLDWTPPPRPVIQTIRYIGKRMSGTRANDFASSPRSVLQEDLERGPKDVVTGKRIKKSYRTPKTATDPEEVQVTGDFVDETGHELANGWVLGKKLGQGMQGSIYVLNDKEGNDLGEDFT